MAAGGAVFLAGCQGPGLPDNLAQSYLVTDHGDWLEAVDCAGRNLALVPWETEVPPGFIPQRVIRIPVKRVVAASGTYDPGIIMALGELSVVVGSDELPENWYLPEILEAFRSGSLEFVGLWDSLDFEVIRRLKPDVILSSSLQVAQTLESLGFVVAVTYSHVNNDLDNRIKLFDFLGALLGRRSEAQALTTELKMTLELVTEATKGRPRPQISWGIYFNNRVYPLNGDFWLSQIFEICGGDYVLSTLKAGSMELNLESFLVASAQADIYFASVLYEGEVKTKADYLGYHPELSRLKSFGPGGRVYMPEAILFQDTGRLSDMVKEVAAIIHPEIWPDRKLKYFRELL
jgi:iron complex transport system substrate-binding protein